MSDESDKARDEAAVAAYSEGDVSGTCHIKRRAFKAGWSAREAWQSSRAPAELKESLDCMRKVVHCLAIQLDPPIHRDVANAFDRLYKAVNAAPAEAAMPEPELPAETDRSGERERDRERNVNYVQTLRRLHRV